jgi:hypothetical protein
MFAVNQLNGFNAAASAAAAIIYGCYIFNGTDEYLSIAQGVTSADRTKITFSFWLKTNVNLSGFGISPIITSVGPVLYPYCLLDYTASEAMFFSVEADVSIGNEETGASTVNVDNTWNHWVVACDTTQATSDNRIRFYKNGTLITDSGSIPGSSALTYFFTSGQTINVGNEPIFAFSAKRLAFVDVLDGVLAGPTDFAFDNGGTWTRKPYVGSYGSSGFCLDGSNGFTDTSINGRVFTGTNMTIGANIDIADLPPYT